MADRIVVMRDGHIAQVGAPLELYDAPASTFVAGFIGSPAMNLIEGRVRRSGGAVFVEAGGVALPLDDRAGANDGRRVVYGIRPEHLDLAADGVPATVAVVEPTGSETHVVVRAGGGEMVAVFRDRHAFRPGDRIHLAPRPGLVHLFDADTTERIA